MVRIFYYFWSYFRQFQPPAVRILHGIVLVLVLIQMVSSNLIRFDAAGQVVGGPAFYLGTWTHIATGLLLVPIGMAFVVLEIVRHDVRYFFPYLFGEFSQLKADIDDLKSRRLPEAKPGSLAAIVQGLGLGALGLTLAAGLIWFLLWQMGSGWAEAAKSLHAGLTGLVQAYVVGHGGLGLLHIFIWNRSLRSKQAGPLL